jgi:hypothetical protein
MKLYIVLCLLDLFIKPSSSFIIRIPKAIFKTPPNSTISAWEGFKKTFPKSIKDQTVPEYPKPIKKELTDEYLLVTYENSQAPNVAKQCETIKEETGEYKQMDEWLFSAKFIPVTDDMVDFTFQPTCGNGILVGLKDESFNVGNLCCNPSGRKRHKLK